LVPAPYKSVSANFWCSSKGHFRALHGSVDCSILLSILEPISISRHSLILRGPLRLFLSRIQRRRPLQYCAAEGIEQSLGLHDKRGRSSNNRRPAARSAISNATL
jgi:hypothetical protein